MKKYRFENRQSLDRFPITWGLTTARQTAGFEIKSRSFSNFDQVKPMKANLGSREITSLRYI